MEKEAFLSTQDVLKSRPRVEIIIPTLNEEVTISETLRSIMDCNLPVDISILVIDGGSTDRTAEICKNEGVNFIVQRGRGKGAAMRQAVEATSSDIVVFIDGDGTYAASEIIHLLEPLLSNAADMVVGSRFLSKREHRSLTPVNVFGNLIFNKAINFSISSQVTDSLSGFRAIYRHVFDDLILFSDLFEIEVEMTVEAISKGYRVLEVPISYKARQNRSNTKLAPLGDGWKIAKTLLLILVSINPLRFFGIVSLILFSIALWPASQVLYEKIVFGSIASVPAAILAALLFISVAISLAIGLMSESIARSRRRLELMISRCTTNKDLVRS